MYYDSLIIKRDVPTLVIINEKIFNYLVGDVASNSQGDLIISACFDFLSFEYGNSLPTIPSSIQTGFLNCSLFKGIEFLDFQEILQF